MNLKFVYIIVTIFICVLLYSLSIATFIALFINFKEATHQQANQENYSLIDFLAKNNATVKIKAVVDFYGPTDLTDMYNNPASIFALPSALAAVVGATPTSNPALYQQSSPINYVTAQSPPTIILHGGVDIVVSFNQSVLLKNKLQTFGVIHQYVFYPTENHGWGGANMVDSFDKITAFLNANVN